MDVTAKWLIDRIDNLRGEKNMSEYRLCELSGVTTSTMSAMRRRTSMPQIQTIIKICDVFGISLSDFFKPTAEPKSGMYLSDKEMEIVTYLRNMTEADFILVLTYAKALSDAYSSREK